MKRESNPSDMTTIILLLALAGAGYYFLSKKGGLPASGGTPPSGGGGGGGMSYQDACGQAKAVLGGMESYWSTASCDQIASLLKSDKSLFVAPNAVRTALGA